VTPGNAGLLLQGEQRRCAVFVGHSFSCSQDALCCHSFSCSQDALCCDTCAA
jgi:hypothetical protein